MVPRGHCSRARVHMSSDTVAPSELALLGRYVLTPGIFAALARTGRGAGGEIQLTDAIKQLLSTEPVVALEFEADYFDVGTIPGFLKTSIALGRAREDLRVELDEYLQRLISSPPDRPPSSA